MPELNCPLPAHLYALLRAEFLYDMGRGHGSFVPCVLFGVTSVPGRALGFHAMTGHGGVFSRLPVHAFCWRPCEGLTLGELQAWDCFGYDVSACAYPYLSGMACSVHIPGRDPPQARYVCTFDWLGNGFSDEPTQSKTAHLLRLDRGDFALQPNNRVLWNDPSFTDPSDRPDYSVHSRVYHAEDGKSLRAGARTDTERHG